MSKPTSVPRLMGSATRDVVRLRNLVEGMPLQPHAGGVGGLTETVSFTAIPEENFIGIGTPYCAISQPERPPRDAPCPQRDSILASVSRSLDTAYPEFISTEEYFGIDVSSLHLNSTMAGHLLECRSCLDGANDLVGNYLADEHSGRCPDAHQLRAFAHGTAPYELEDHVAGCPHCQELAEFFQLYDSATDDCCHPSFYSMAEDAPFATTAPIWTIEHHPPVRRGFTDIVSSYGVDAPQRHSAFQNDDTGLRDCPSPLTKCE